MHSFQELASIVCFCFNLNRLRWFYAFVPKVCLGSSNFEYIFDRRRRYLAFVPRARLDSLILWFDLLIYAGGAFAPMLTLTL